MTVRRAGPGDARALARLRWQWRVDEEQESATDEPAFAAAFGRWVEEHRESHLAWLAEVDGEPVGMAWLAIIHRVPGPAVPVRLAGHLQSVYVRPDRRDRGVGAALVTAVIAEGRRRGLDYVWVHPSVRSVPLYRRAGFRENAGVLHLDLRRPPAHG